MSKKKSKYAAGSPVSARAVLITLAVGACLALLAWAGTFFAPADRGLAVPEAAPLTFSEVMTANAGAWPNSDGDYYDWVELCNSADAAVSTAGWKICNSIDVRGAFALPERTLAPNERMVISCAGRAGVPNAAAFALNKDGASLFLIAPDGAIAEMLRVPPLKKGEVYARDESSGEWSARTDYTPGSENTAEAHMTLQSAPVTDGSVVISEVMAANEGTIRDADGDASDWIELHNQSQSPVSLRGWSLTTDLAERQKWQLPDDVLQPDEYRIVFASGKNRTDAELHANFRLSAKGERVYLIDPDTRVASCADFGPMEKNQSFSRRTDGTYTTDIAPSPGYENTAAAAYLALDAGYRTAGENAEKLYINEICCSMQGYSDWLEIFNASDQTISLAGWGLSDSTASPKWVFPGDASIAAGAYKIVFLNGNAPAKKYQSGKATADFAVSASGGEVVTLFRPDGTIADAVALPQQRGDVSYGRADGCREYRYFSRMTPGAANAGTSYGRIAAPVEFSRTGGMIAEDSVAVELSTEPGCTIRYTVDGSEPDETADAYTQPIVLSQTAVVRAKAFAADALPSQTAANTYLFGETTDLRVVCVSGSEAALTGDAGVLKTGEKTKLDVSVEVYDYDGAPLVSQACEMMVIGSDTRLKFAQKAMRFVARSKYGDSRFRSGLFTNRDYGEYKAFTMRASGQDCQKSHMRDSVLSALAADTQVFYQETELAALYVNGQYWGMYNMREHIDAHSICQFEDWSGMESSLDILEGREILVAQGSKAYYQEMMDFVRGADFTSDATIERLRKYCDIENYLDYVALMMYVEQEDLDNIRIYRNPKGDGLWRWVIFDLDLSFSNDKNSARVWLEQEGHMDAVTQQDNTLFYRLMQNAAIRDRFLTRMGELLATSFTPQNVIGKLKVRYDAIGAEMEKNCARWGTDYAGWQKNVKKLAEYASTRTEKLIGYFQTTFRLTDDQVQRYFGEALANSAAQ